MDDKTFWTTGQKYRYVRNSPTLFLDRNGRESEFNAHWCLYKVKTCEADVRSRATKAWRAYAITLGFDPPENGVNDPRVNKFRHCVFGCELKRCIGDTNCARTAGKLYENKTICRNVENGMQFGNPQAALESALDDAIRDLTNNEIGFWASDKFSTFACSDACKKCEPSKKHIDSWREDAEAYVEERLRPLAEKCLEDDK